MDNGHSSSTSLIPRQDDWSFNRELDITSLYLSLDIPLIDMFTYKEHGQWTFTV